MVTLIVSAWLATRGTVPPATITYTAPATRASVLIEDLVTKTGLRLEVTPQTADEVLLVRVKDASVDDLLRHIASAADAEWVQKGEVWRLTRTTERQAAQLQRDTLVRSQQIGVALKVAEDEIAKAPKWSEQRAKAIDEASQAQMQRIERSRDRVLPTTGIPTDTPVMRTAIRLLRQVGPVALAGIRDGDRVVFSLRPTPMQRALTGAAMPTLRDFVGMQQDLLAVWKPSAGDGPPARVSIFSQGMGDGNASLGIGNGFMAVVRNGDMLITTVATLDPNGQALAHGQYYLMLRQPSPPESPSAEPEIPLSPVSREFVKGIRAVNGGGLGKTVVSRSVGFSVPLPGGGTRMIYLSSSPGEGLTTPTSRELLETLTHPEATDPVNLVVADTFGKAVEGNLVANFPDRTILSLALPWTTKGLSKSQLLKASESRLNLRVTRSNGWTDIVSSTPAYDREFRTVRPALGKALRTVVSKTSLSVEDLATWSLAQGNPITNPNDFGLVALAQLNMAEASRISPLMRQPYGIRLLGTLTARQRAWALQDGLPVAELSPNQRGWVTRALMEDVQPRTKTLVRRTPTTVMSRGRQSDIATDEPTLCYPEGLPKKAILKLDVSSSAGVVGFANASSPAIFLTPELLAAYRAGKQNATLDSLLNLPIYSEFIPAKQSSNTFSLLIDDDTPLTQTIDSVDVPANSARVPFASLGEDFRRATEAAVGTIGEKMRNISFGGTRPQTP